MHKVWQAGVSLYPACIHTGTLCPFPSLLLALRPQASGRTREERRLSALLFRTFEKSLSLSAGFFVAGTHAFKMFLKGSEQRNEIKNPIKITLRLPYYVLFEKRITSFFTHHCCSLLLWFPIFPHPDRKRGKHCHQENQKEKALLAYTSHWGAQVYPRWLTTDSNVAKHKEETSKPCVCTMMGGIPTAGG